MILVNIWRTKNTYWIVRYPDADTPVPPELAEKLAEAVERLPVRVHVPRIFTELSSPRYFAIAFRKNDDQDEQLKIIDVVGVRATLTPTWWSYRIGYWHPYYQILIAKVLRTYATEAKTPATAYSKQNID